MIQKPLNIFLFNINHLFSVKNSTKNFFLNTQCHIWRNIKIIILLIKKLKKKTKKRWSDLVRCDQMWSFVVRCGHMWSYVVKDSIWGKPLIILYFYALYDMIKKHIFDPYTAIIIFPVSYKAIRTLWKNFCKGWD